MPSSSRIPDHVREAFDSAVEAHRRFHEATFMPPGGEKVRVRRKAVTDLAAANRVLTSYDKSLVEKAGRVAAQQGGAR